MMDTTGFESNLHSSVMFIGKNSKSKQEKLQL